MRLGRGSRAGIRHFAYLNARVQAMRGRLLPRDTYAKLLQMEIPQIARFLGETEYKAEIEQLTKRYRGVDLVEAALNQNLASTFQGLIHKAQYELKDVLELYLRRYDIENIVTVFRGKLSDVGPDELKEALIPAGELKVAQLHALVDASYDDMLEALRKLGYPEVVEAIKERPLPEVDDMMRMRYYEELLKATEEGGKSMALLHRFARSEVDFRNLINLLRLKRDQQPTNVIMEYMIPNGLELSRKELEGWASMEFDAAIADVEHQPYFRETAGALRQASYSLVALEAELTRQSLRWASRQSRVNPLSILVPLSFILAKQVEVDNIRSIVRGKEGGLPLDLIRRTIVV
jgi:V/A-type H+-transporting ATPase subunit C